MPHYGKGAATAEAASKAQSGARADFLSIKSGERKVVRPLTDLDEIITIDVHMGVPTKAAPKGVKEDKWPAQMSAVCQNSAAFRIWKGDEPTEEWEEGYGHCYIHEHMKDVKGKFKKSVAVPTTQVWGLFVMREAVIESGKVAGFRDVTEEHKTEDGTSHTIPKIVIASQSWSNFWAQFSAAAYMTGTITDRDFMIERSDNDYTIQPGREIAALKPGTPGWQRYLDALEMKDLSVEKVLADQSSEKYYGRFFIPGWVDPDAEEEGEDEGGEAAAQAGETTLDDAEAERMKAQMAEAFAQPTQPT